MWLALLAACHLADAPPSPVASPAAVARAPKTWIVDCTGGGDFAAIPDAIAAAHSGDTISVRPCTYYGQLRYGGKSLRIASTDGAAVTTLVAPPGNAGVEVHDGEGPGTALVGFTVSGGGAVDEGGIDVEFSTFLVESCVVTGTNGTSAIHGRSSNLTVRKTTVTGNTASYGWMVYAQRGGLVLVDSQVDCDGVDVGVHTTHGSFFLDRDSVNCPTTQSFWNEHSIGRVQRSTLVGLAWHEGEGADECWLEDDVFVGGLLSTDGQIYVRNSVVVGAPIQLDNAVGSTIEGTVIRDAPCGIDHQKDANTIRNNAFFNLTADYCGGGSPVGSDGNLAEDCKHVSPATGDWHLKPTSPCIDAGPDLVEYRDPDGSRNDIGVYGGPKTQGGGW